MEEIQSTTQGCVLQRGTEAWAMEEHCLLACSASFLIYPMTTYPEVALTTVGRVLPHQSLNKKMCYKIVEEPV